MVQENSIPPPHAVSRDLMGLEENTYCMLLHLSQFAGWVLPGAGVVVPILLWIIGKDRSAEVDWHGRSVFNWMISELIYVVVSVLLMIVLIGIPMLITFLVLGIVFPILGAVKADAGRRYRYPLSIPFFSLS